MADDLLTEEGLRVALDALSAQTDEDAVLHYVEIRADRMLVAYFVNDEGVPIWRVWLNMMAHTRPFGFCEFEVYPGGRITFLQAREAPIEGNPIPLRRIDPRAVADVVGRARELLGRPDGQAIVTFTRSHDRLPNSADALMRVRLFKHANPGSVDSYRVEDDADGEFTLTATLDGKVLASEG